MIVPFKFRLVFRIRRWFKHHNLKGTISLRYLDGQLSLCSKLRIIVSSANLMIRLFGSLFSQVLLCLNRISKVTQPCSTPEKRVVNLDFQLHIYEERIIWGFTCVSANFGARRFRWNMLKAKLKSINKTQA